MRLPIGYDIFGKVIEQKLDLIDKSLFIKDVLDDVAQVILITRPRRFGKTLNLSMLHYFLAKEAYKLPTKGLFEGFKITALEDYMQHQGKYPVIFVTFKDVKDHKFEHAYACLRNLISQVYAEHQYLLENSKLSASEKKLFEDILNRRAQKDEVENSLKTLSGYLFDHFGVKPWLLIDEYDTPIQAGYVHSYYEEMINLMRGMFGAALKTNPYLHKAVITGILRVSKENSFSGLNNIEVYSVLQEKYSQYFGFTEEEMNYILQKSNLETKTEQIKNWYNGYQFGKTIVYNPWSIVNCIEENGKLQPYWVNTSDNNLIRNLIINSSLDFKEQCESLLQNIPIEASIDEHVTFGDLKDDDGAIWSLLLASGYLKVTSSRLIGFKKIYTLAIPNLEVSIVYRDIIEQWLSKGKNIIWYNRFLGYLLQGDVEKFAEDLKVVMQQIVSVHDVAKEPEAFYHGLMLGLTASLNPKQYQLKSNKESGYGRYDIVIIPKDVQQKAVILELKNIKSKETENQKLAALLEQEAEKALAQIDNLEYESEIKQQGVTNIVKIGLAFCGKKFTVKAN